VMYPAALCLNMIHLRISVGGNDLDSLVKLVRFPGS
jgi:hypothetical protein